MIHLHVHSRYSMLSGTASPEELARAAKAYGQEALALTDYGGLYGGVEFYKACRSVGIRPILGADLIAKDGHAVLLARSLEGFKALCRLITAYHKEKTFKFVSHLPHESQDLFVLISDLKLLENLASLNQGKDSSLPPVWALVERFESRDSRIHARQIIDKARFLGVPLVAAGDVHFLRPEHYSYHLILRAIDENTTLDSPSLAPPEKFSSLPRSSRLIQQAEPDAYFKSPDEMKALFEDLPEAIENTRKIAAACQLELPLGQTEFPHFLLPSDETAYSYLWKLCFDGVRERYQPLTPKVVQRLNYEMSIIHEMRLAPYFLIVWEIVRFCREKQIPCMGRGSAADSLVSYVLGITQGCPIQHDLYFERFLNPERKGVPDIDLDLCWRSREKVLNYVFQKYGLDQVAMICTFSTFCARSALREVSKVFGLPGDEINCLTKSLPYFGSVRSLEKQRNQLPETRHISLDEDLYRQIWDAASFIDGFPRHIGTHACGIVVSSNPLTDKTPLQIAPGGLQVTQYDMHGVEDIGLLKIDLLGMRSLSVIADVNRAAPIKNLPLEGLLPHDEATYRMIHEGRTIGCFQLESPGMRQLLVKLNVDNLDTLIDSISVIRPGPNDAGMMRHYVDRHNDKEPVKYLDPRLEPILESTYGILLYQEDVLKVASAMAGMTLGQADVFRRAMTKLRTPENMASVKDQFIQGALEQGTDPQVAEELWRQVSGFSGYAFCKAHSVSYGILAYQSAYLKKHFPALFMKAVLNNRGGFYSTAVYVEEARRMGLRILSPDLEESEEGFTAGEDWLRTGLSWIKHLSESTLATLLKERKRRPFASLSDFYYRVRLTPPELESLICCGALDRFGVSRPKLLWQSDLLIQKKAGRARSSEALFEGVDSSSSLERDPLAVKEIRTPIQSLTLSQKLRWEWEILGFTPTMHPMQYLRSKHSSNRWTKIADLVQKAGRKTTIAGIVRTTKRTRTRQKQMMKFITLEDETGLVDVVLFPDQYQRWGRTAQGRSFLIVSGKVQNDAGSLTLEGEKVEGMKMRVMPPLCNFQQQIRPTNVQGG